jgi:hypothetical protein
MTAQLKDSLIINGESFSVLSHIDALWSRKITKLSKDEQQKLPLIFFSTACYRNYVATWEIIDDKLYLVKLRGAYALVDDEPDFVEWYSGTIKISINDVLKGIEIKSGNVISISEIQADKTTNFIIHLKSENLNFFSQIKRFFNLQ